LEMLALNFKSAYSGRRVLVTGHTGFKGSWLTLWLSRLGASVTGAALAPPSRPNHWDLLGLEIDEHRIDVRDADAVRRVIARSQADCVFHLAAQPLVRRSYAEPVETWSTNVMGAVNVLDACRTTTSVKAIVVATSDKCYANRHVPHRESDRLGGHDPYSASKGAVELVAQSYRDALLNRDAAPLLATARAGNVIGGGDWGEDRLIPDLVRAQTRGASLAVRSPDALRPWQHVLDCLAGYLLLGSKLLAGDRDAASAWNFGPSAAEARAVSSVLAGLAEHWPDVRWHEAVEPGPRESAVLLLDSTRARTMLGWQPVWSLDHTLAATASWYREWLSTGRVSSPKQLDDYMANARLTTSGAT
jgi:CDP-glucose 4,6-dehydratase